MKKFLPNIFLTLFVSSFLFAASDTTSTEAVTSGVIHTKFTLPGPLTVDVLEVDLKNPNITIESYKPNGLTRTTVQSAANDKLGHRVIGAVNADFFSFETGWPIDNQVVNGKAVLGIDGKKSHFALTTDKKPLIDGFTFDGEVFAKNGLSLTVNGCNTSRGANQTILFSSFKGASTGTDQTGQEISVQIISPTLSVNDTLLAVVTQKGNGNLSIPAGGYVLSAGSGSAATFVTNNFSVSDTIKLYVGYSLLSGVSVKQITQMIGGRGRLVKDGVAYPTLGDFDKTGAGFNDVRHPRTFMGMNADSSKLYICTVDGRQTTSIGMTFTDMANFLLRFGVTNAFNLDGGGSTTMVVRGKVVNSPSDPGGERSVANSLQIISTAPMGTLHYLNIIEDRINVFQGNSYTFHAEGRDEYLNPLSLPTETVWSADSAIGTIDSNGVFKSHITNDSGWVRIHYGLISDSVKVVVRIIKQLQIYPSTLTMVPGEQLTFSVRGIDSGDQPVELQNSQLTYQVNTNTLNVSTDGVVTATGFGSGKVIAKIDTVAFTIPYSSSGGDTTILAENFQNSYFWGYDVVNTDPDNVFFNFSQDQVIVNPPAVRIRFDAPPASQAILKTNMLLSSRPDTIKLNIYGDGGGHTVKLFFTDKDGQEFSMTATSTITWNNQWKNIFFRLVNAAPTGIGTVDFPITITKIQFTVGSTNLSGGKAVDTLYVDDLYVHYSNRAVSPTVLYNFNSGISGWLQPLGVGSGQTVGISASSSLAYSTEHPYEGSGSGKWTFIDDAGNSANWNIRIARTTSAELADMLRGSYIGAWVWANGNSHITMRTVIRAGATGLCQGPAFPVNHFGWKLIGVRLNENLFTTYLTSGKIVDTGNKFNGFHVEGNNADLNGKTVLLYIDKMVTSALTVPSGFVDFGATVDSTSKEITLNWSVNSEISINRYEIERSSDGVEFEKIGSVAAIGNTDTTKHYSFDDPAQSIQSAKYRIVQITNDGAMEYSPVVNVIVTGIGNSIVSPFTYSLEQNFPNPFNPTTRISFSLAATEKTTLKIYDLLGREIATLADAELEAGQHSIEWNSSNISSGVYFYRLETSNYHNTKKMVVMK